MLSVTSCDATMDGISSSVITSLAVANRSFGSTMSRSRAASTAGGSDSARTPTVLSRWASRYLEGRNLESAGLLKSTAEALIQQNHARQVVARDKVFKQGLPFSWLRFFIGVGSLALVFSDIFRGGLGVSSLEKYYPSLHPDEVLGFGTSWNYSVFAATKEDAYSGNVNATVWTYKFDSTSIVWRAFANHLSISEYPDCFLYKSQCPSESFDGDAAYRMIDSVVDAIAGLNSTRTKRASTAAGPVGLTLRTENDYIDRLHQFLLPKWFTNFNWRTNQALYYSPQSLLKANARSICFPVKRARVKTPRFCRELWTNLNRSCAPSDTSSRAAGLLYVHTMERLREIQARFPNATVDLTFLESQEDMQVCRGSLTTTGFRRSDVSTIIRARHCVDNGHSSKVCETVFVEDYRYETGLLISDVVQWYTLVASLRGFGQTYFWLRGLGLMLSCFFVFGAIKERTSIQSQIQKTRELLMKVPTQCVVYGSSVPVTCYVIAHLLDAPFTYNVFGESLLLTGWCFTDKTRSIRCLRCGSDALGVDIRTGVACCCLGFCLARNCSQQPTAYRSRRGSRVLAEWIFERHTRSSVSINFLPVGKSAENDSLS
ncbi:hypothetical protein ON010_g8150 [Phytophthora cinnamomi]|nr:hypothetical protein ON010_g8150 [Phytophthora cinnamomi]